MSACMLFVTAWLGGGYPHLAPCAPCASGLPICATCTTQGKRLLLCSDIADWCPVGPGALCLPECSCGGLWGTLCLYAICHGTATWGVLGPIRLLEPHQLRASRVCHMHQCSGHSCGDSCSSAAMVCHMHDSWQEVPLMCSGIANPCLVGLGALCLSECSCRGLQGALCQNALVEECRGRSGPVGCQVAESPGCRDAECQCKAHMSHGPAEDMRTLCEE